MQEDVQLSPWNPYFFRPRFLAMSWRIAHVETYSGIVQWNEVSKYAIEFAFGSASIQALMTERAPPLCLTSASVREPYYIDLQTKLTAGQDLKGALCGGNSRP